MDLFETPDDSLLFLQQQFGELYNIFTCEVCPDNFAVGSFNRYSCPSPKGKPITKCLGNDCHGWRSENKYQRRTKILGKRIVPFALYLNIRTGVKEEISEFFCIEVCFCI